MDDGQFLTVHFIEREIDDIRIGEQLTINEKVEAFFKCLRRFVIRKWNKQLNKRGESSIGNNAGGFIFPPVIIITSHISFSYIFRKMNNGIYIMMSRSKSG